MAQVPGPWSLARGDSQCVEPPQQAHPPVPHGDNWLDKAPFTSGFLPWITALLPSLCYLHLSAHLPLNTCLRSATGEIQTGSTVPGPGHPDRRDVGIPEASEGLSFILLRLLKVDIKNRERAL